MNKLSHKGTIAFLLHGVTATVVFKEIIVHTDFLRYTIKGTVPFRIGISALKYSLAPAVNHSETMEIMVPTIYWAIMIIVAVTIGGECAWHQYRTTSVRLQLVLET